MGGETARIGSFEQNSKGMDSCFYGSRVNKGTIAVNQNICLSFDPLSMICLTCATPHSALTAMPPGFVVSDQNYVAWQTCPVGLGRGRALALSGWRVLGWMSSQILSVSSSSSGALGRVPFCALDPAPIYTVQGQQYTHRIRLPASLG